MQILATFLFALPLAMTSQMIDHLQTRQQEGDVCTDTHIFLARGWNEDYPGRQEKLIEPLDKVLDDSSISMSYEDILYISTFEANYCDSIAEGVANGQAQMIAYNKRCPKSKLVVSGYSQGAYVVGDMFAGGGGTFGDCVQKSNEAFDANSDAGKMVSAVLLWGSKRHTASQPYNTFSGADKNGTYPRQDSELNALKQWTSVIRDYCVVTDPNCAGGKINEDHWNYFELYADQEAQWIKDQVDNNIHPSSLATSSNSSTTSSSALTTRTQSNLAGSATSVSTATSGTSSSSLASSTISASPAATSSSESAASASYPVSMIGLAVAGVIAACI